MEATTVVCDCKQLHRRHNTEQYSFKIYLSMTVVYCTVVWLVYQYTSCKKKMFFTERALKVTESETNQVIKLFFSNIFREDLSVSVYVWTCVTLTLISSPPRLHSCLNVCHTHSFSFSSRELSNFLSPPGDTDLSSALFTSTHSALSLTIQQRVFFFFTKLGSVSDSRKAGSGTLFVGFTERLSPSSRRRSGPWPLPHRWWKLWPRPDRRGPDEGLSLYRN